MPKQCMINGNKPPIRYGFQDAAIVNRLLETKCYREEKQDFERLLNKIELSEEFMAMWREEQTL